MAGTFFRSGAAFVSGEPVLVGQRPAEVTHIAGIILGEHAPIGDLLVQAVGPFLLSQKRSASSILVLRTAPEGLPPAPGEVRLRPADPEAHAAALRAHGLDPAAFSTVEVSLPCAAVMRRCGEDGQPEALLFLVGD